MTLKAHFEDTYECSHKKNSCPSLCHASSPIKIMERPAVSGKDLLWRTFSKNLFTFERLGVVSRKIDNERTIFKSILWRSSFCLTERPYGKQAGQKETPLFERMRRHILERTGTQLFKRTGLWKNRSLKNRCCKFRYPVAVLSKIRSFIDRSFKDPRFCSLKWHFLGQNLRRLTKNPWRLVERPLKTFFEEFCQRAARPVGQKKKLFENISKIVLLKDRSFEWPRRVGQNERIL